MTLSFRALRLEAALSAEGAPGMVGSAGLWRRLARVEGAALGSVVGGTCPLARAAVLKGVGNRVAGWGGLGGSLVGEKVAGQMATPQRTTGADIGKNRTVSMLP
jgi:hypothetical protein